MYSTQSLIETFTGLDFQSVLSLVTSYFFPPYQSTVVPTNLSELTASLNFYRAVYKVDEIDELRNFDTMPSNKAVYVVLESRYRDLSRTEGLEVAWRGTISDLIILVRLGKLGAVRP